MGKVIINGYLAFIDILGFRKMVNRNQYGKYFEQFQTCLHQAIEFEDGDNLSYITFSDTVIIHTVENSLEPENFHSLVKACSRLYYQLIREGIPFKGCIAHGEFRKKKDGQRGVMIAGQTIIDAYDYEQKQDWIGIMFHPELVEYLDKTSFYNDNNDNPIKWSKLIYYHANIPFHSENYREPDKQQGQTIIPLSTEDYNNMINYLISDLKKMKTYANTPQSQKKYDNTILYLHEIRRHLAGENNR